MKLDTEFYRLPLRLDAARLMHEASQFAEHEWRAHPQAHAGNTAVALVSAGGDPADDGVRGPMLPTPHLDRCPYVRQVLASLGVVLGRCRFMRIAGQGEASPHFDANYYWLHHVRVHFPALTDPGVEFVCGGKSVHMAAGEAWIFDTWRIHNVLNRVDKPRIHLVVDTVGSATFWDLVDRAERPFDPRPNPAPPRHLAYDPDARPDLPFESVNFPVVLSPWEQKCLFVSLFEDLAASEEAPPEEVARLELLLERFHRDWLALWARFGTDRSGEEAYRAALGVLDGALKQFEGKLRLPNRACAAEIARQMAVRPALNFDLAAGSPPPAAGPAGFHRRAARKQGADAPRPPRIIDALPRAAEAAAPRGDEMAFDRPVFILAAPRSGSSMLFETLARSPDFWTVGGESHEVFEGLPHLRPAAHGWESNRLTEADADADTVAAVRAAFRSRLRDREGRSLPADAGPFRMLEKTPKNALRLPFLLAAFPDARFVYLARDPRENLASIIEAWASGKFVTYPDLPGWPGPPWSLLLTPGWRGLKGKKPAEIAAAQWEATHRQLLDDLAGLPRDRWIGVNYADVVADPQGQAERLCQFAGVSWDQQIAGKLPQARHTLTPADPEKWRKHEAAIEAVLPAVEETGRRITQAMRPKRPDPGPIRSVHSATLPALLGELGVSLLVTTYQAGQVFILRDDGGKLNTHFRALPVPMGLALQDGRLAVGTKTQVLEFRDQPDVTRRLEPPGKHDACFMPRSVHFTGDIRIHEMAYAGDELWFVNTRFSCLCTLDGVHSFVPRWRPPFITALAPEDRCHLNGLAVVDGRPRYVTCLGRSDDHQGWRANKASGGCVLEVPSGEPVATGLSMPHSPRRYDGRLWVLESGSGTLSVVDEDAGRAETVAELPGFTRGLDFHGPYAFVGLSEVRESNAFSGLPITRPGRERMCGVVAIDLRDGRTVGFMKFESGVQEIFAVEVLAGSRFPEIVTDDAELLENSFVIPDEAMRPVKTSGNFYTPAVGFRNSAAG